MGFFATQVLRSLGYAIKWTAVLAGFWVLLAKIEPSFDTLCMALGVAGLWALIYFADRWRRYRRGLIFPRTRPVA